MKKISAVYKIVNTVTGEFYVGSSRNVKQRWMDHKKPSMLKRNPNSKMYQDMQKYGVDKFRFQILAPVMPEYLTQVEQKFIETLQPSYNSHRANGWDVKRYEKSMKKAVNKYRKQLCSYNGETLTLGALSGRFHKAGIKHYILEAKKYLIK